MRVLVMMSGGVDSSVAAALVRDQGHEVVGATLKLWGGPSDSGCCSLRDVDDARRAADRLDVDHHVLDLGDLFDQHVVAPYVADHASGRTPNPCIECNRHIKFAAVADHAERLGFDAVATGHHARIVTGPDGGRRVARGADAAKDQSYVLHVLDPHQLERTLLPIGGLDKAEVRRIAAARRLRTADKPDSQDVCFITRTDGRRDFLGDRIPFRPARVVDTAGTPVGRVPAVELVTIGQRKGLGLAGGAAPRYVVEVRAGADVDPEVVVGGPADLLTDVQLVAGFRWAGSPVAGEVEIQVSAHGRAAAARVEPVADPSPDAGPAGAVRVRWSEPQRRVAPGQSVVAYVDDVVVGGGLAS